MNNEVSDGYGIASFVLSIVGLLGIIIFFLGIIPSILSLVFARKQRKIKKTGLSTAGLVMGIIGTIINGFFVLIILIALLWAVFAPLLHSF
jgi:hypothetical protein